MKGSMKKQSANSSRAKTWLSLLAVGVAAVICPAIDLQWIYDTSQRIESVPSTDESASCKLDAMAMDEELSNACGLSSLPPGFFIIVK